MAEDEGHHFAYVGLTDFAHIAVYQVFVFRIGKQFTQTSRCFREEVVVFFGRCEHHDYLVAHFQV